MLLAVLCFTAGTWFGYQGQITAFMVCYIGVIWFTPFRITRPVIALKALLTILLTVLCTNYRLTVHTGDQRILTVRFLDVGQGDSTLLELPDGTVALIDTGTSDSSANIIQTLRSEGIHTIDLLIGTHPHTDHIGGMPAVLDAFQVKTYIQPNTGAFQPETNNLMNYLSRKLQESHIAVQTVSAGTVLYDHNTCKLEVLAPVAGFTFDDLNDYSIILKLMYGDTAILFMADAGYQEENAILDQNLDCNVLKVGHHGSFGSSGSAFLKQADPHYAVISVGSENDHHLPNEYVLEKLGTEGIIVYRTDEDGTITVTSDGTRISITTEK